MILTNHHAAREAAGFLPGESEGILVARAILGDPIRRGYYDQALATGNAELLTLDRLKALAATDPQALLASESQQPGLLADKESISRRQAAQGGAGQGAFAPAGQGAQGGAGQAAMQGAFAPQSSVQGSAQGNSAQRSPQGSVQSSVQNSAQNQGKQSPFIQAPGNQAPGAQASNHAGVQPSSNGVLFNSSGVPGTYTPASPQTSFTSSLGVPTESSWPLKRSERYQSRVWLVLMGVALAALAMLSIIALAQDIVREKMVISTFAIPGLIVLANELVWALRRNAAE